MKLEKVEKTALLEALDDFRDGKSPVDDLEFNDKITVEMPYFSAKAIKDIQERDAKIKKILEPVDKAAEELLKDTEAQKAKSEKESKSFKLSESYLKENFENRWSKNENTYTVKCNGRKDLRTLIAEAKAQGIKYKFNKLLDEDYKYDFIYTIEGGLQPAEETLEESKLTEAPDQYGIKTDDEIEAEERAEFEKRLAQRKSAASDARKAAAEEEEKAKAEKERAAKIKAEGEKIAKELENANWDEFVKVLVPESGKADTVAGEIVRAIARIEYRYFNDGDLFNQGYGRETAGSSAVYLYWLEDFEGFQDTLIEMTDKDDYSKGIEELKETALDYLKSHPELFATENKSDSRNDKDFPISEVTDFEEPRDYEYEIYLSDYYKDDIELKDYLDNGFIDSWDFIDNYLENDIESELGSDSEFKIDTPWSHYDITYTITNLTKEEFNTLKDCLDNSDYFESAIDELYDKFGDPNKVEESLRESTSSFNPHAHKVIVDKYWSKDNDDSKDIVYIILPRQKVFVKLTRKEMFDKNLHYGTFIDQVPVNTEITSVDDYANDIIKRLGAKEVSTDELTNIENKTRVQDTAQAFAHAEKSFQENLNTNESETITESVEEKTSEPKEELKEAFDVIGNLTNYTPWGNAVEIWEVIKGADKVEEFDSILTDLYPNGLSLNELNDFLSTKEEIVRTLLDLDTVEPVEEVKEIEEIEEPVSEEEIEAEDDNIDDIESLVDEVPEVKETTEEERAANRERFLNTETGFDEEDEDDISDIASLA